MKIKLDENLPFRLADSLRRLGHETDTVPQEGIGGADDSSVWEAAQTASRFFITQDMDFSDIRYFTPGSHAGILLVRLHQPGRNALVQRISSLFEDEDVERWSGCFVVVTEHKIRIRSPR